MPERATVMSRSEKSAEAIVAARRRAEREGESNAMSLGHARHQKPGQPGRTVEGKAREAAGIFLSCVIRLTHINRSFPIKR